MPKMNPDERRRRHRPVRRQPNTGVVPRDDHIRQLILKAREKYSNATALELKAFIEHDNSGVTVHVNEIFGVLNGK